MSTATAKDRPTDEQNAALRAFVACVVEGLNPSLHAIEPTPRDGSCEYELQIGAASDYGVLQEEIETAIRIANDHGGHIWVSWTTARPAGGPGLFILWPLRKHKGPSGPGPLSPGDEAEIAKRGGKVVRERASR